MCANLVVQENHIEGAQNILYFHCLFSYSSKPSDRIDELEMGDELPLSDNENEDNLNLDFDDTDDEV